MTIEEKAELVLKLVVEIVEESTSKEYREMSEKNGKIGGLMNAFGSDYIARMRTFSRFFTI